MSHHGGTFLFYTIPMENDFGISDFLRFALLTSGTEHALNYKYKNMQGGGKQNKIFGWYNNIVLGS